MVIDVNKLARQGKDFEQVYFDFPVKQDLILSEEMKIESGSFNGEVLLQDKIYINGTLTIKVTGPCSRCLENAEQLIEIQVEETFSQRPEEDEYRYKSGLVDLTEMINDKILSNQPSILLCKNDCKGLCPKCGCNLNDSACNCEK